MTTARRFASSHHLFLLSFLELGSFPEFCAFSVRDGSGKSLLGATVLDITELWINTYTGEVRQVVNVHRRRMFH